MTEIIKEPTRTTCNAASLLDHILTTCAEKVSQKGVIDVGLSDHQLIFCTRKIRRTRRNIHNQIQTRSLRNYSAENLISTLKDIKFPNYDIFSDVNVAYADLTKISDAIDNVAPIKTLRIKTFLKIGLIVKLLTLSNCEKNILKNSKNPTSILTMIFTLRQNIKCKN